MLKIKISEAFPPFFLHFETILIKAESLSHPVDLAAAGFNCNVGL